MTRWFEDEAYRNRRKQQQAKWMKENKEVYKKLKKRWIEANKEKNAAYNKEYYLAHKEKQKAEYREWRNKNNAWTKYYQYLYANYHERPDWKEFLKKEKLAFQLKELKQ